MRNSSLIVLALMTALSSTAMAVNPLDFVPAQLQSNLSLDPQDLQKKAVEHISQGDLTAEHISKDVNATKEQLKKQATDKINKSLNLTAEQLQQRAKEELKNQVNQRVQQPGFESFLAIAGILGTAFVLIKRWN
jgi:hypothetical protein